MTLNRSFPRWTPRFIVKFAVLGLMIVLAASLAACGGTTAPSSSSGPVTLTFWTWVPVDRLRIRVQQTHLHVLRGRSRCLIRQITAALIHGRAILEARNRLRGCARTTAQRETDIAEIRHASRRAGGCQRASLHGRQEHRNVGGRTARRAIDRASGVRDGTCDRDRAVGRLGCRGQECHQTDSGRGQDAFLHADAPKVLANKKCFPMLHCPFPSCRPPRHGLLPYRRISNREKRPE